MRVLWRHACSLAACVFSDEHLNGPPTSPATRVFFAGNSCVNFSSDGARDEARSGPRLHRNARSTSPNFRPCLRFTAPRDQGSHHAPGSKTALPCPACQCSCSICIMNRFFQRRPAHAGHCECTGESVSGTDGIHGIYLRRGDLQNSIRGEDEHGLRNFPQPCVIRK